MRVEPFITGEFELIQENETRFGTYYQVVEQFLKAVPQINRINESHLSGSGRTAYMGLKKTTNIDGAIVGFPGIEATFDGFEVIVDCIVVWRLLRNQHIIFSYQPFIVLIRNWQNFLKAEKCSEVEDVLWSNHLFIHVI